MITHCLVMKVAMISIHAYSSSDYWIVLSGENHLDPFLAFQFLP